MGIKQVTLVDFSGKGFPKEVYEQVTNLWMDMEFGNDNYYFSWKSEYDAENYPVLDKFLQERNITHCLIHWSW